MEIFIHKTISFKKDCEMNKPVQLKNKIILRIHFQTQIYYKKPKSKGYIIQMPLENTFKILTKNVKNLCVITPYIF